MLLISRAWSEVLHFCSLVRISLCPLPRLTPPRLQSLALQRGKAPLLRASPSTTPATPPSWSAQEFRKSIEKRQQSNAQDDNETAIHKMPAEVYRPSDQAPPLLRSISLSSKSRTLPRSPWSRLCLARRFASTSLRSASPSASVVRSAPNPLTIPRLP